MTRRQQVSLTNFVEWVEDCGGPGPFVGLKPSLGAMPKRVRPLVKEVLLALGALVAEMDNIEDELRHCIRYYTSRKTSDYPQNPTANPPL